MKPDSLFENLKADFISFYKFDRKIEYFWEKKDNAALGQLIQKAARLYPDSDSQQVREYVRVLIKAAFTKAPDWIKKSLTVSLMNSQFNVIRDHTAGITVQKKKGYYDSHKHEVISRGRNQGEITNLDDILTGINIK